LSIVGWGRNAEESVYYGSQTGGGERGGEWTVQKEPGSGFLQVSKAERRGKKGAQTMSCDGWVVYNKSRVSQSLARYQAHVVVEDFQREQAEETRREVVPSHILLWRGWGEDLGRKNVCDEKNRMHARGPTEEEAKPRPGIRITGREGGFVLLSEKKKVNS